MDRSIVYPSEQARDVDFLFAQRAAMTGLGDLAEALLGSNDIVVGCACTPTAPASLDVQVAEGQIYSVQPVDATAYGSLAADTTDTVVKQGILSAVATLSCPAPTTVGYSINYLIEAAYQDSDTTDVVLPYFNSANPSQPLSGENNGGAAQPTERQGLLVITAKAGAAAATGAQTTPATDVGNVALYVVTVAYGQTQIIAANIVQVAGAPLVTNLLEMVQTGSANYAADIGAANAYVVNLAPAPAALTDGMVIIFRPSNPNNGPSTLDVNGFGAFNITAAGGPLQGGEILTGALYEVCYVSGTNTWSLIGQSGGSISVQPATESRHAVNLEQILVMSSVVATSAGTVSVSVTFTAPCKGVVLITGIGGGSGTTGVQITGTNVTIQNGATVWAAGTGAATVSMAMGLVASGAAVTLTSTIDNATTSFAGIYCLFLPSI